MHTLQSGGFCIAVCSARNFATMCLSERGTDRIRLAQSPTASSAWSRILCCPHAAPSGITARGPPFSGAVGPQSPAGRRLPRSEQHGRSAFRRYHSAAVAPLSRAVADRSYEIADPIIEFLSSFANRERTWPRNCQMLCRHNSLVRASEGPNLDDRVLELDDPRW